MGLALLEAAAQTEGVMLGAAIDLSASTWGGVSIGTDVGSALANSDVLIDFTRPAGTLEHVRECVAQKRAMVIGLGSGVTLGAVACHPLASVDCVEISPAGARPPSVSSSSTSSTS